MKTLGVALALLVLCFSGIAADPPNADHTTHSMTASKRWDADSTEYWLRDVFYHHASWHCSLAADTMDTVFVLVPPAWLVVMRNLGDNPAYCALTGDNTIGPLAYQWEVEPGEGLAFKDAARIDSFFVWWYDTTDVRINAMTPEGEGY